MLVIKPGAYKFSAYKQQIPRPCHILVRWQSISINGPGNKAFGNWSLTVQLSIDIPIDWVLNANLNQVPLTVNESVMRNAFLNFQEQKSLVQEVIKTAGHMCIFLPKFHCEINFIEFFWGSVKRHHLRENCDYSFTTICQMHLHQLRLKLFGNGSIGWNDASGWRLMRMAWMQKMHKYKSKVTVQF